MNIFPEQYRAVAISTQHITPRDVMKLSAMASGNKAHAILGFKENMVTEMDTGYFIKLYEEPELNQRPELSDELNTLIALAHKEGARLLEIDADAAVLPGYSTFDW